MKKVFIVGGTSGFGLSLAKKFHIDHEVTVCGRKKINSFNSMVCDMVDITEDIFKQNKPNIIPERLVVNGSYLQIMIEYLRVKVKCSKITINYYAE